MPVFTPWPSLAFLKNRIRASILHDGNVERSGTGLHEKRSDQSVAHVTLSSCRRWGSRLDHKVKKLHWASLSRGDKCFLEWHAHSAGRLHINVGKESIQSPPCTLSRLIAPPHLLSLPGARCHLTPQNHHCEIAPGRCHPGHPQDCPLPQTSHWEGASASARKGSAQEANTSHEQHIAITIINPFQDGFGDSVQAILGLSPGGGGRRHQGPALTHLVTPL